MNYKISGELKEFIGDCVLDSPEYGYHDFTDVIKQDIFEMFMHGLSEPELTEIVLESGALRHFKQLGLTHDRDDFSFLQKKMMTEVFVSVQDELAKIYDEQADTTRRYMD